MEYVPEITKEQLIEAFSDVLYENEYPTPQDFIDALEELGVTFGT